MFGNQDANPPEVGNAQRQLMYSVEDVARQLGNVTPRYVNQLIATGELPSIKLGRRRLVEHDALMAFVAKLRAEAEAVRARVGGAA